MSYAIVHWYSDGSGLINVFGPYDDESVAAAAELDLERIGLQDQLDLMELLPFVPFDETDPS